MRHTAQFQNYLYTMKKADLSLNLEQNFSSYLLEKVELDDGNH